MIETQFIDVEPIELGYVHDWFEKICIDESKTLGSIGIVFGSDYWLLEKNKQYLNHDFFTDIITFDYCEGDVISGDLLISIDRIIENAEVFNVPRETEMNRVLVHGLLHLCGYSDKTDDEIKTMREKEDYYLSLL